ncbi:hypothetical protein FACS1894214_0950 [Planctomycetales bacterium]|nr:hypothetical protein FACS1894214_0950 [Planctomycetales bacterium]
MAEGKQRADWNRTSHLLALISNVNRDPKKSRAVTPQEVNPYTRQNEKMRKPDFYISPGDLAKKLTQK